MEILVFNNQKLHFPVDFPKSGNSSLDCTPPIQWHIAIACSPRFAHRKCRFYFEVGPAFVLKTMDSKWNPSSQEGASQVPSLQAIVDTCVVRGLLQQAWCLRKRQFSSRQMQGTWGICGKNAKMLLQTRFCLPF